MSNVRTYIARLSVTQGEFEHNHNRLVVAMNENEAWKVANSIASNMWGESDPKDGSEGEYGYTACGGELAIRLTAVREIGLASFLDLKAVSGIAVYCQDGMSEPTVEDLSGLRSVGDAVHSAFAAKGLEVPHVSVLNALASAVGSRNWNQYRATAIPVSYVQELIKLSRNVSDYASNEGCDDDLTVTSQSAINALMHSCAKVQKTIDAAKAAQH